MDQGGVSMKKLVMIGYRPGMKSRMIRRTDVLCEKVIKHVKTGIHETITVFGKLDNPYRTEFK